MKDSDSSKKHYWLPPMVIVILSSLLIMGLIVQLDGVYSDYVLDKIRKESPGIMFCFVSTYQYRWITDLLVMSGIMTSSLIFFKNQWKLPELQLKRILIFSPLLLEIVDQVLVRILFF